MNVNWGQTITRDSNSLTEELWLLSFNAFRHTVPTYMQMKHCREINMIQAGEKNPSNFNQRSTHSGTNPCCGQQVGFLCFNINLGDNIMKVFHTKKKTPSETSIPVSLKPVVCWGRNCLVTVCVFASLCCRIPGCCF